MRIPAEQKIVSPGGEVNRKIAINPGYTFTQVTVTGRGSGVVTPFFRPILDNNQEGDFLDGDFESITGGAIDLAVPNSQRTFTIENKRATAIMMQDAGVGEVTYLIRQWGVVR